MTLKSDTAHEGTIGCPRCKIAMEEVARIMPLQKVEGLIADACPSCDSRSAKYCRRTGVGVRNNLALKLRPAGLSSGIDKDRADYFFLANIS
jgi:hypothetical protein